MPQTISFKEFLRIFKDNKSSNAESRFCFILGAGASVASGIKSGATLSRDWLQAIGEDLSPEEYAEWVSEYSIDTDSPELHYPTIYQKRFANNPKSGHEALMHAMSEKEPSIGYPFFAQLLVETHHNIVITTNFDSLIESSVYRYTNSQPLVIGHENLAHFLDSSSKRPIIAKIHRDLLLNPKNSEQETSSLPKEWRESLKQILQTSHIVIVGYGGNDGSLMDFLTGLNNRQAIYWCKRHTSNEELPAKVNKLLTQDSDRVVNIPDFDGLMIELATIYDCPTLINKDDPEQSPIIQEAKNRAKQFQRQIDKYADDTKESTPPESSIRDLVSDWYDYQIKVDKTTDITQKERIYEEGIAATNHPYLICNYAIFLTNIKDHDAAEKYFLKALEAEPNDAKINSNYANFLNNIKKGYGAAEQHFLKALEAEPNNAKINTNYANFLTDIKKDDDAAEKHYLKSLEAEPNDAKINTNYANFLTNIKKDYDAAEKHYLKALKAEPNNADINSNYAIFLTNIKDYDAAKKHYLKALKAEPNDAKINTNYAIFLTNIKKDYDAAQANYLKALKAEPNDAKINTNYAIFLTDIKNDYDAAEEHYFRALETEPNDASINSNYALFLTDIKNDHGAAEKHYLKALKAEPNNAQINDHYAHFLTNIKKDYDAAEKHHLKALETEPNNANMNGNYAKDLFICGKTKLAIKHLELAEEMNKTDEFPDLALECAFYEYAHLPNKRKQAELEIISLLEQGISSKGFDLSQNVEKAITKGHPNIQALRDYAQRISAL